MAFDLTSAKPIEESGGFDLSTATPVTSDSEQKDPEWFGKSPNLTGLYGVGEGFKKMVSNVPSSVGKTAKDIYETITSPKETVKGIYKLATGDKETWGAIKDDLISKYGSLEKFSESAIRDPVGTAMDVSAITGVGGIAGGTTKTGKVLRGVSKATDPISMAGKVVSPIVKPFGEHAVTPALGVSTGVGKNPLLQALEGGKSLENAMRGGVEGRDILETSRDALSEIKKQRSAGYKQAWEKIENTTTPIWDKLSLQSKYDKMLKEFEITKNTDGTLNFNKSPYKTDPTFVKDVERMGNEVVGVHDDFTPKGMDTLKRQLDNFYGESKHSRAITESMRSEVKGVLDRKVPGYAALNKAYEKSTGLITDIQKALSLNTRSSADTAITKLKNALNESNDFRMSLVQQIDKLAGADIEKMIAGYKLQQWHPQGWLGRSVDAGVLLSSLFGVANPQILAVLAMSSPRIMGEFYNTLGKSYRLYGKYKDLRPVFTQAAYQFQKSAHSGGLPKQEEIPMQTPQQPTAQPPQYPSVGERKLQ